MATTYNAGIVTAYGAAVRGGYTGTYEQYCEEQAHIGTNAQRAESAADRAEAAADEAASHGGFTEDIKAALLQISRKVAYIDEHGQDYYDALYDAFYPPVQSISASYTQPGTVYTTDDINSLKNGLVVRANYADSTSKMLSSSEYTLSGTLVEGTSTITVHYGDLTASFTVTVTTRTMVSITAQYTQSGAVYEDDTLDDLKADLVVTASWNDGTETVVTGYTLSGTLSEGTSTITVTYEGFTDTFTVTVSPEVIDYTLNPLEGVEWLDGYSYQQGTGELTATSGEHCTRKFRAQNCIYTLTNSDTSNNRYFALFAWNADGDFIGFVQYNATVFSLRKDYTYAIKVYNTATFDASTISLMPKDNSATAASAFSIRLADYIGNISANNYYYEINVSAVMSSAGVTAANIGSKINKCNRHAVLTPISTTRNFEGNDFTFWFYNINTLLFRFKDVPFKDLTSLEAYLTTNDPIIEFN